VEKKTRNLYQLVLVTLFLTCSCTQQKEIPSGPVSLLPAPPAGWRQIQTLSFSGLSLSDYINGGAELYHAYGFQELAVAEAEDSDVTKLTVEIYRMDRSENAYGIFSTDSKGDDWNIGVESSYGDGLLRFWEGPYFVRILSFPATPAGESAIRESGAQIAGAIVSESRRPEILKRVPQNAVADSVCYFHRQTSLNNIFYLSDDNILRLGDDVEAVTWTNSPTAGNREMRHILAQYPSQQMAVGVMEDFAQEYRLKESVERETAQRVVVGERNGAFAGAWLQDDIVAIVVNATSADAAEDALEEMRDSLGNNGAGEGGKP